MSKDAEHNLVERAMQGDAAAVAELFKRYWRAARAAAFGIIGNIDLAEDAASEALYKAFKNIDNLHDAEKFGPWLHKIVIRTARHLKNSKTKNIVDLDLSSDKKTPKSISDMEQREFASLIHEAVDNLQDILREAISLYYFEGYNVEQIADFLDVPTGTVKRRLHDGRNALHNSAQKILQGTKPLNNKREQTLKLLNDFLEKGGDSDEFRKVMGQAMKLRPVPFELLRKIFSKHSPIAKKLAEPGERQKYELRAHKAVEIFSKPSERVTDSNHPVGKVVIAIKSALPQFKEREADTDKLAQNIIQLHTTGEVDFSSMPPGFAEGIPGSFISLSKGMFFEKEDGSLCTMYELKGPVSNDNFRTKAKISDTLYLIWLRTDIIDLHSVEELLRKLSGHIVPEISYNFSPFDEPHLRSALKMQFENVPVPAATGGVHFPWPGLPEGVSVASVQLYLEAWASAKSGQQSSSRNSAGIWNKFENQNRKKVIRLRTHCRIGFLD
jgi:RNA polymerase sigma-70 factor (ECF subfamily)